MFLKLAYADTPIDLLLLFKYIICCQALNHYYAWRLRSQRSNIKRYHYYGHQTKLNRTPLFSKILGLFLHLLGKEPVQYCTETHFIEINLLYFIKMVYNCLKKK